MKNKKYSYNKLRGRIVEKYGSQKEFAKVLGISENSVSQKMNCASGFSQNDIEQWSFLLGIQKESFTEYFFA